MTIYKYAEFLLYIFINITSTSRAALCVDQTFVVIMLVLDNIGVVNFVMYKTKHCTNTQSLQPYKWMIHTVK